MYEEDSSISGRKPINATAGLIGQLILTLEMTLTLNLGLATFLRSMLHVLAELTELLALNLATLLVKTHRACSLCRSAD